ncbi:MAG: O-antigen ligase family protein [SAR324 cluster bacterium]|nr:O-antigen ligase family protein [SAR324 cluster bacterium]
MQTAQHSTSKFLQTSLIVMLSVGLGAVIPFHPIAGIVVVGLFGFMMYTKVVLRDYHMILAVIILVVPFNFESLISAVNIPFVNPFNVLWLSYVGIVVLRSVTYSETILIRTPLNFPIFLVIITFTISLIQGKYVVSGDVFKNHLFPLYQQWLQWILFYFFCLKGLRTEKEAKLAIIWVLGMVMLAGIQNIRDYASMMGATSGNSIERASGFFGNANDSAGFFCYYVPVAVGLALSDLKEWKLKLFFSATAGIGLIAVVVTYSRSGMASAALGCLIVLAFSKINVRLIAGLMIVVAIIGSSENIRTRFSQTSIEGPYGKAIDPSVQARLIAWSKAYYLFQQRPIIGHGFFTFRHIKVDKFEDEAAKAHGHHGMAVHNAYLNVLVNSGLTGLLSFLSVILVGMKMSWSISRKAVAPFWKGAALGMFAGLVCLLIVNMSGTRIYDRQMMAYLWIILAALYKGHEYSLAEARLNSSIT